MLINNMSVEDFLENMFNKEVDNESIYEEQEQWYSHTTEWKYSDNDIINSVAKYVYKREPNYRGEFYKEIHDLIYYSYNDKEARDLVVEYFNKWDKSTNNIDYINYVVVKKIVFDIIKERESGINE